MPPSDYRHVADTAAASVVATPYAWLKLKAVVKNWKLRDEPDTVEGHRILGEK